LERYVGLHGTLTNPSFAWVAAHRHRRVRRDKVGSLMVDQLAVEFEGVRDSLAVQHRCSRYKKLR
jgi:hypothetical protein